MLKQKNKDALTAAATDDKDIGVPYWTIFRQAMPQLFNIFFIFFVTLALFPAVQSGKHYNLNKFN